jgi:methylthioribose-1-phosphate isomerase
MKDNIPTTVICDNMAASLMRAGKLQAIVVGADRIAANGDVANKVGTVGHALAARHAGIPFLVAAPESTVDADTPTGSEIPIELRDEDEVLCLQGLRVASPYSRALNPAFDITPAALVTAIVTERRLLLSPAQNPPEPPETPASAHTPSRSMS